MNNLAGGNVLGGLDSASRNGFSIPGYQFCKATGYIALKTTPYNRFPLVESIGKGDGIDRLLSIPRGARIYYAGVRTGEGFVNRLNGHNLHLVAVDPQGVAQPLVSQAFGPMRNSDAQNFGAGFPLNPLKHPSGRLENKVLAGYPSNDNDAIAFTINPLSQAIAPTETFAAINTYLQQYPGEGISPEYTKANPGPTFEIQCRIGPNPNDILSDLLVGGLLQNPKPDRKNKGYAIVDIGYVIRDLGVSTSENLNVAWDEVFKYVF